MSGPEPPVTALLRQAAVGDHEAEDRLLRILYAQLHRMAANFMRKEGAKHTLQPTALVNEAYVRLMRGGTHDWRDRGHFLATASVAMRRILVDHARRRAAAKRGSKPAMEELHPWLAAAGQEPERILAIDQALGRLAARQPRQARVVEMRYFAGLADAEVAEALGVSVRTVKREWSLAKAWLYDALRR